VLFVQWPFVRDSIGTGYNTERKRKKDSGKASREIDKKEKDTEKKHRKGSLIYESALRNIATPHNVSQNIANYFNTAS